MTSSLVIKAAIISALALPARVFASPFDAARIPADADGVGHLDMDAMRRTALHRLLLPKINKKSQWDDLNARLRPLLRALFDGAHGVSFWLTDRDTGAVLIQVPDPRRIQGLLDRVPHRGQVRVAGHLARRVDLSDKDGKSIKDEPSLVVIIGNQLIMADDEASLARAIGAATGKVRNLAQARGMPDGGRDRGLFFFTALNHKLLHQIKDAARSATLRVNMTSMTVHVAEVSSEMRIRARLMMGSAQEAQKLKSMIDGVIALTSLSDDEDVAQMRRFTSGLKLVANGKALEVTIAVPSVEVAKAIE